LLIDRLNEIYFSFLKGPRKFFPHCFRFYEWITPVNDARLANYPHFGPTSKLIGGSLYLKVLLENFSHNPVSIVEPVIQATKPLIKVYILTILQGNSQNKLPRVFRRLPRRQCRRLLSIISPEFFDQMRRWSYRIKEIWPGIFSSKNIRIQSISNHNLISWMPFWEILFVTQKECLASSKLDAAKGVQQTICWVPRKENWIFYPHFIFTFTFLTERKECDSTKESLVTFVYPLYLRGLDSLFFHW
jgi:hypothetical protein